MSALSFNPVHCMDCNRAVAPDRAGLSPEVAEAAADWIRVARSLELLELDSGPYERWARRELQDIQSPVNVEGRKLAASIGQMRRCYFVYFTPHSDPDWRPLEACPSCGSPLEAYASHHDRFKQFVCDACSIVVFN